MKEYINDALRYLKRAVAGVDIEDNVLIATRKLISYQMYVADELHKIQYGTTLRRKSVHDELLNELIAIERVLVSVESPILADTIQQRINNMVRIMHYNQEEIKHRRGKL